MSKEGREFWDGNADVTGGERYDDVSVVDGKGKGSCELIGWFEGRPPLPLLHRRPGVALRFMKAEGG